MDREKVRFIDVQCPSILENPGDPRLCPRMYLLLRGDTEVVEKGI
jgi:hypothetical protein